MGLFVIVNPQLSQLNQSRLSRCWDPPLTCGLVTESQQVWVGILLESSEHRKLGFVAGKYLLET